MVRGDADVRAVIAQEMPGTGSTVLGNCRGTGAVFGEVVSILCGCGSVAPGMRAVFRGKLACLLGLFVVGVVQPGIEVGAHIALVGHPVTSLGPLIALVGGCQDFRHSIRALGLSVLTGHDLKLSRVQSTFAGIGGLLTLVCGRFDVAAIRPCSVLVHGHLQIGAATRAGQLDGESTGPLPQRPRADFFTPRWL
jgi:hypothetical protein